MPHCIIEYAKDIDVQAASLINAVFQGILQSGLFEESHIKTRAIAYDHYQAGQHKHKFIHITAKIISGRTTEQRSMLSQSIIEAMTGLSLSSVTITVEIIELEKESYAKIQC